MLLQVPRHRHQHKEPSAGTAAGRPGLPTPAELRGCGGRERDGPGGRDRGWRARRRAGKNFFVFSLEPKPEEERGVGSRVGNREGNMGNQMEEREQRVHA